MLDRTWYCIFRDNTETTWVAVSDLLLAATVVVANEFVLYLGSAALPLMLSCSGSLRDYSTVNLLGRELFTSEIKLRVTLANW
jgi:hypothetical protein